MQTCSKCNAQSPDTVTHCENCGADLSDYSNRAVALKKYQSNARVNYVRIVVSNDACPACQKMEGAYDKMNPPKLPIGACSNPLGCRCFYLHPLVLLVVVLVVVLVCMVDPVVIG